MDRNREGTPRTTNIAKKYLYKYLKEWREGTGFVTLSVLK